MAKNCLFVVLLTIVAYACYRFIGNISPGHAPLGLLLVAPFIAKGLAPIIFAIIARIKHEGERSAVEKWHGRVYSYDGHQIRLYFEDTVIWVPAADVAFVLLPAPDARELRLLGAGYAVIPDQKKIQGYSDAALLRLLAVRLQRRGGTRELTRFQHWLENQAFPNVRRLPSSASNQVPTNKL